MRRRFAAFALAATMLQGTAYGQASATEPQRLVMQLAFGTHLPGVGEPAQQLASTVKLISEGRLVLGVKQPGEVVQPHEILQAVSSGKVDAGFSTASFWAAEISAAPLFSGFPFGPDASGYLDWFYAGNGRTLYQEMYEHAGLKVHVLPCAFGGAETAGWFKTEIGSVEDLKGLRMRIFGLGGRVVEQLGVVPKLIQGGRVLDAFQKGEIDAAELYPPGVDARQNLQHVVKHIYVPGWHQPETVFELLINKERWNSLAPGDQALIELACKANLLTTFTESRRLYAKALADFAASGVAIMMLPGPVMAELREAWAKVAAHESNRDAFFKEVLTDLEKFRAKQGLQPRAQAPQSQ